MPSIKERLNTIFFWPRQVLPPLCLLVLAFWPPDFASSLLWLIGIVAGFVSIVNIIRKLIARILKKDVDLRTLTRPCLTVICMLLAIISITMSINSAMAFGRKQAESVQAQCDAQGVCPETLPGWETRTHPSVSSTRAGRLATYRVTYSVTEDRKEFTISVRRDLDSGRTYSGGVGKKLKEDDWYH